MQKKKKKKNLRNFSGVPFRPKHFQGSRFAMKITESTQ